MPFYVSPEQAMKDKADYARKGISRGRSVVVLQYADGMSADDAILACMQALYDAADDDSATGGPDLNRRIFPIVSVITEDGFERLPEPETEALSRDMVEQRGNRPDGPNAAP